jgi:hypothetical protein
MSYKIDRCYCIFISFLKPLSNILCLLSISSASQKGPKAITLDSFQNIGSRFVMSTQNQLGECDRTYIRCHPNSVATGQLQFL